MSLADPPEGSVTTGDVLAGKYRVTRVLGRGGMGVVVEARHMELGERVAIKVLHPRYCTNAEATARFHHEAKAAVKIRGEHSVRLIDVGATHAGAPFIVMELLEGADLAALIKQGPISLADAVLYILQACEGMAEVHGNGIIHRDLKPGNLFVARRPDGSALVKVLDFGIAKSMMPADDSERNMTMTLVALGTPLYMSPEQVRCSKYVDTRTDVWSLGAILYELVAGRPAFGGNTVANITAQVLEASPESILVFRRDVPAELDRVIRKALSKKPEHRFPDVAAFAHALAPFGGEIGKAHAERATRILRGDGRITASIPAVTGEPETGATTQMESEILTTHIFARRRKTRAVMAGMALLGAAALVSTWLAIDAYLDRAASQETAIARSGLARAGQLVTMLAVAQAAPRPPDAISLDTLPTASATPSSGPARPKTAPAAGAPQRPRQPTEVDPLSTRK